ncbi:MAG TPA: lipocalin-like domain-containing protein [Ktedonobacterales bacterium]
MSDNPFVGTWRLVSVESRTADGRVRYPYGRDAQGYIIYSAEGTMCVAFMAAHRPRFANANDAAEGTPEELAAAGKLYVSYAGPYEIQDDGTIHHHVEVSFFPNWIGSVQERLYTFEGNRLTLSTRPVLIRGLERSSHLVWERVS